MQWRHGDPTGVPLIGSLVQRICELSVASGSGELELTAAALGRASSALLCERQRRSRGMFRVASPYRPLPHPRLSFVLVLVFQPFELNTSYA